ncbi:UNVERIFIED_CONTAM: glycosyltransferase family 4 protein [Methylobacteriaceae bacterium AG10]|nr:glycosyltransferase family 4 protein [Methylobacteriaceae bacterium AG10]
MPLANRASIDMQLMMDGVAAAFTWATAEIGAAGYDRLVWRCPELENDTGGILLKKLQSSAPHSVKSNFLSLLCNLRFVADDEVGLVIPSDSDSGVDVELYMHIINQSDLADVNYNNKIKSLPQGFNCLCAESFIMQGEFAVLAYVLIADGLVEPAHDASLKPVVAYYNCCLRLYKEQGAQIMLGSPGYKESGSYNFPIYSIEAWIDSSFKKRVAFYVENLSVIGGLEEWVRTFSLTLRDRRMETTIIVLNNVSTEKLPYFAPVNVVSLGGAGEKLEPICSNLAINTIISNHVYEGISQLPASVQVIEVIHNIYFWQRDQFSVIPARSRTDKFVAISQDCFDFSVSKLNIPKDKVVFVPHGLYVAEFPRRQLGRTLKNGGIIRGVCVANGYPQKNLVCLIEAVSLMEKRGYQLQLSIAGTMAHEGYKERINTVIESKKLSDSVKILGRLDRLQLKQTYLDNDFFVLPSLFEGFGLATLEAAYFGLPFVVSNTGFGPELALHGGGIVVNCSIDREVLSPDLVEDLAFFPSEPSIKALAEGMMQLVDNLENYRQAAQNYAESPEFRSMNAMAEDYIALMSA